MCLLDSTNPANLFIIFAISPRNKGSLEFFQDITFQTVSIFKWQIEQQESSSRAKSKIMMEQWTTISVNFYKLIRKSVLLESLMLMDRHLKQKQSGSNISCLQRDQ